MNFEHEIGLGLTLTWMDIAEIYDNWICSSKQQAQAKDGWIDSDARSQASTSKTSQASTSKRSQASTSSMKDSSSKMQTEGPASRRAEAGDGRTQRTGDGGGGGARGR